MLLRPQSSPQNSVGQHLLNQPYTFWYLKRGNNTQAARPRRGQEAYEQSIKKLGSFETVEEFWAQYNHMVRPSDLPMPLDYHLFRSGVKPMWEDPQNQHGGRFMLRVPRGKMLTSRYWEDLVLAIIGAQFDVHPNEICGAHAHDIELRKTIEESLKRILKLPTNFKVEFKAHDDAMKEASSTTTTFRAPVSPQRSPQKRKQRKGDTPNKSDSSRSDRREELELSSEGVPPPENSE